MARRFFGDSCRKNNQGFAENFCAMLSLSWISCLMSVIWLLSVNSGRLRVLKRLFWQCINMSNRKCGGFFYIKRLKKHILVENNPKLLFVVSAWQDRTEIELFRRKQVCGQDTWQTDIPFTSLYSPESASESVSLSEMLFLQCFDDVSTLITFTIVIK